MFSGWDGLPGPLLLETVAFQRGALGGDGGREGATGAPSPLLALSHISGLLASAPSILTQPGSRCHASEWSYVPPWLPSSAPQYEPW